MNGGQIEAIGGTGYEAGAAGTIHITDTNTDHTQVSYLFFISGPVLFSTLQTLMWGRIMNLPHPSLSNISFVKHFTPSFMCQQM